MNHSDRGPVWFVIGVGAAVALGVALTPLRTTVSASTLAFVFIALTIIVAEMGGRGPGLATAVVSALSLNFFLTEPYLSLEIHKPGDIAAFLALAACGLIAAAFGKRRVADGRAGQPDAGGPGGARAHRHQLGGPGTDRRRSWRISGASSAWEAWSCGGPTNASSRPRLPARPSFRLPRPSSTPRRWSPPTPGCTRWAGPGSASRGRRAAPAPGPRAPGPRSLGGEHRRAHPGRAPGSCRGGADDRARRAILPRLAVVCPDPEPAGQTRRVAGGLSPLPGPGFRAREPCLYGVCLYGVLTVPA